MAGLVHSIEELVGRTPLMELDRFERQQQCGAHLLAKLEFFNPTGSVKDRAALSMLNAAEEAGLLKPGGTIVEQTSGNTGIGLAAFAAERGYKLDIFLERGASLERRLMLLAYGARLLDYKDATGERPETKRTHPWQEPEREATLAEIAAYCGRMLFYFDRDYYTLAELVHLPGKDKYSACVYIDADGSSSDRTAYAKNIAVQVDEWRRQNDIPFDKSTIAARPADTDGGEFDTMDEALRYLYTCLNFPDSVLC